MDLTEETTEQMTEENQAYLLSLQEELERESAAKRKALKESKEMTIMIEIKDPVSKEEAEVSHLDSVPGIFALLAKEKDSSRTSILIFRQGIFHCIIMVPTEPCKMKFTKDEKFLLLLVGTVFLCIDIERKELKYSFSFVSNHEDNVIFVDEDGTNFALVDSTHHLFIRRVRDGSVIRRSMDFDGRKIFSFCHNLSTVIYRYLMDKNRLYFDTENGMTWSIPFWRNIKYLIYGDYFINVEFIQHGTAQPPYWDFYLMVRNIRLGKLIDAIDLSNVMGNSNIDDSIHLYEVNNGFILRKLGGETLFFHEIEGRFTYRHLKPGEYKREIPLNSGILSSIFTSHVISNYIEGINCFFNIRFDKRIREYDSMTFVAYSEKDWKMKILDIINHVISFKRGFKRQHPYIFCDGFIIEMITAMLPERGYRNKMALIYCINRYADLLVSGEKIKKRTFLEEISGF